MAERISVQTCRWARPTIRTAYPYWIEAEDKPWSCLRDGQPRPLADAAVCADCERWQPHRVDRRELPRA